MAYKIAIASSDGVRIDETFGAAKAFHIYEVTETGYTETELRQVPQSDVAVNTSGVCGSAADSGNGCGGGGCNGGPGGGCGGSGAVSEKVALLSDCRCIVCRKIGFPVQKQLERRAITAFDVSCTVEEALTKISAYFYKVDTHQSLRKSFQRERGSSIDWH